MEEDPTLPMGEERTVTPGKPGWAVNTWRVAQGPDGHEIVREYISQDVYPPQPAVVLVNPGVRRSTTSAAVESSS